MLPQSQFLVLAQVARERQPALLELLESMNRVPGLADPANPVLPFGQFEQLHFARLAVLDDPALADIEAYGLPRADLPVYLALAGC